VGAQNRMQKMLQTYKIIMAQCSSIAPETGPEISQSSRGEAMTITVELELLNPYDLTAEEIEKDLRMAEDQIGWNYNYSITDVKVT